MIPSGHTLLNTLLVVFDLAGTFVFALSGATMGVKHRLDLFGVLVLSYAAGNAGGITRDVLIGAVPPAAVRDWRYVAVSILAGLLTFYWYRIINLLRSPVLVFDAAGLALFAVSGAGKALVFGAGPVAATLLGMLTGIGGGMLRDILVREIPTVLRTELYAVAALVGAAMVVLGRSLHLPTAGAAIAGDRKSTRLNSSHVEISYAVFCLNPLTTTSTHTLSLHDALPICCGDAARHADRDRRRHVARHPCERDSNRVANRTLCCRGPGWSGYGGAGKIAASSHRRSGNSWRSEEHTSELQSRRDLVCRLLLESSHHHQHPHSFPTRRSSDLLRRRCSAC